MRLSRKTKLINNNKYMNKYKYNYNTRDLRGAVKKKNSIFVDIIQIGGREVNPMSKNLNEIIF